MTSRRINGLRHLHRLEPGASGLICRDRGALKPFLDISECERVLSSPVGGSTTNNRRRCEPFATAGRADAWRAGRQAGLGEAVTSSGPCADDTEARLGEIVAKQSRFTPLLESTSCGNRPVRRANLSLSDTGQNQPSGQFSSPSARPPTHCRRPDSQTHKNIQQFRDIGSAPEESIRSRNGRS